MGGVAILAGFEPFGPYPVNPTAQLARKLDGQTISDVLVKSVVMPATYLTCHFDVMEMAVHYKACRIVTFGLATRVQRLRIETIGRNRMESMYPDAVGLLCKGEPLYDGLAQTLSTNSDPFSLLRNMKLAGVPCEISDDAEGFVCNALIYHVLYTLNLLHLQVPYIHIHTPWTDLNLKDVTVEPAKAVIKWEVLERAAEIALTSLSLVDNVGGA